MNTNNADKLNILRNEREDMRRTVLELDKGLFKTLFAFLTITLTIIAIDESIIGAKQDIPSYVSFLLSQVLIFIGFFAISQLSLKTRTLGYIRALEDKINKLTGEKLIFFHSNVTPHPDFRKSHWGSIFFILIIVVTFLVFFVLSFYEKALYLIIILIEIVPLLYFLYLALQVDRQVQDFSSKMLNNE